MLLVADSSAIIALAAGDVLFLLENIFQTIGSVGVIILGKKKGHIKKIKPILDKIIKEHIYINNDLYNSVLKEEGEL